MKTTRTILALMAAAALGWGQETRADDLSWVEKRVEKWQPKPSERKFDLISWAPDVRTGLALAKKHNRPFFLVSFAGKLPNGRC